MRLAREVAEAVGIALLVLLSLVAGVVVVSAVLLVVAALLYFAGYLAGEAWTLFEGGWNAARSR